MAGIKERLKKLVTGPNFWRAVIVYGSSLGIGLLGFILIEGAVGDYMLTCFPGFGTGVAVALLNNGSKQPVTLKSTTSTFVMLLIFTAGSYIIGIEILAVFVGFGFSVVGSIVGLRFCMYENKKYTILHALEQCTDNDEDPFQLNTSESLPHPEEQNE